MIWKQNLPGSENNRVNVVDVNPSLTKKRYPNGDRKDFDITKHRIFAVEVLTHLGKMVFICCYGVPETRDYDAEVDQKDLDALNFFRELNRVIEKVKKSKHVTLVAVLGDLNVQIPLDDVKVLANEINWPEEKINTFANFGHRGERKKSFLKLCKDQKLAIASVLSPNESPTYEEMPNGNRSYIDHFAIGWVKPKDKDWTEDNSAEHSKTAGIKTLDPNGYGICTKVRVTGEKLPPDHRENYHFLCIASLDLRNATDRMADRIANKLAKQSL